MGVGIPTACNRCPGHGASTMWRPLTAQRLTASPLPQTPIQSLPFWWPCINPGTCERTFKDLHAVFPRSGDLAHWKPQSTSLAISGACLSSRVEGWEQVPVLFP